MKKNEESKQKQENLENQLKRAVADYQNLEKRVAAEKSDWIKLSNKDLLLRLLPGLDSLILAEKHTKDEGVKIAIDHFLGTLKSEGIEKIDTIGQDFSPHLMEAVSVTEGEDGKVVEEVKAGYTLNGEVLRPAQVIVGKGE
jgi:molecular chaperone GrpE